MGALLNRRTMLGTVVLAPIAGAAVAMPTHSESDATWAALVLDFKVKRAIWLEACEVDDTSQTAFAAECDKLLPEPRRPHTVPEDLNNMTLAAIRASTETPGHKAAWAAYEREHVRWMECREALRKRIYGPAKARYDATYADYADAYEALISYPTRSLAQLREKIEIIIVDRDGCDIEQEDVLKVLADVRHLSGLVA